MATAAETGVASRVVTQVHKGVCPRPGLAPACSGVSGIGAGKRWQGKRLGEALGLVMFRPGGLH